MADLGPRVWPALDLDVRVGASLPKRPDETLALAFDDLPVTAVEDQAGAHWRVYFDAPPLRDAARERLQEQFGPWLDVQAVDVPDEGWALEVQQDLGAVRVGQLVVAPPWDLPPPGPDGCRGTTLVIEPSTGFGTGHHQSTRVCLLALQRLDLRGTRVIDAGTGSGVLAIAAAMLGAGSVLAVDVDDDAVAAARGNVERNGVVEVVECRTADLGTLSAVPATVVVANLTAFLLRRYAAQLDALVTAGGVLVTSGFTQDQVPLVTDAFPGYSPAAREDEDDWVSLTLRRTAGG